MAIGERIRFFRRLRGLTQKELGLLAGFPEGSADVRLAQYESGSRCPKGELTLELSKLLGVSPRALNLPDTDSLLGLMHTLFSLEDLFGLTVDELDGEPVLRIEGSKGEKLRDQLLNWAKVRKAYQTGERTQQDYDRWRYNYPDEI